MTAGPQSRLIKASQSTIIGAATVDELEGAIRAVVGLLGIRTADLDGKTVEQQILTMTAYLRNEYKATPISELTLAYRLYVKGELVNHKGAPLAVFRLFDPPGLGEVMKAYERYKVDRLGVVSKPLALPAPDPQPTDEQLDAMLLADFTLAYNKVLLGFRYEDLGNGIYNRLDAKGLIPFTDERKREIFAEAVEQIRRQTVARSASGELTTSQRRREKTLADAIKEAGTITSAIDPKAHGNAKGLAKQIALRYLIADLIEQEMEPGDYLTQIE